MQNRFFITRKRGQGLVEFVALLLAFLWFLYTGIWFSFYFYMQGPVDRQAMAQLRYNETHASTGTPVYGYGRYVMPLPPPLPGFSPVVSARRASVGIN